jgi:hypothetical protein
MGKKPYVDKRQMYDSVFFFVNSSFDDDLFLIEGESIEYIYT